MNKEKRNSCSFNFITNLIIKKYFLFLFVAVTIFVSGFFIFNLEKVFAESITENFVTTSGEDVSGDSASAFIESDITKLSASDDSRIQSNGDTWPIGDIYDETKYLEFIFSPNIPEDATIESVTLTNEFRRSGAMLGAKLEVWDGTSFSDYDLTVGTINEDHNDVFNLTLLLDTPEKVNNFKARFLAYRGEGGSTKTSHDFIGLQVVYDNNEVEPATYTEITEDISSDTTWTKENGPYVINSEIFILEGATLNIGEGVVVKFGSDGALVVNGKIEAQGIETDKIYFTSLFDDTVGGDIDADGGSNLPSSGDWQYIFFDSSETGSVLSNVIEKYSNDGLILYNGSPVSLNYFESDGNILAFGSHSTFSNIKVSHLELYEASNISIENSILSGQDDVIVAVNEGSSLNIKNSKIESDNSNVAYFANNSSGIFDGVEVITASLNRTAISVYLGSSLLFKNSSLNSVYSGFEIFNGSSLNVENSDIVCGYDGILVYIDSSVDFKNGSISALHDGLMLYSEATANIEGVKISDSLDVGVLVFNNINSAINITKSEITNNEYGFVAYNTVIAVHDNSIHDNFSGGAITYLVSDLDFTSNYWGDKTGPTHSSNASGLGDIISDHILFIPFLESDPLVEEKNPVILIPGITGTYLYKNYGDNGEIWPNVLNLFASIATRDSFLNELILNENGTGNINFPVVTGDIIRGIATVHVFDRLIEELTNAGYVEGTDLFVFPYDWRFSTEQTAGLLKERIDNILNATGNSKVDIIAHSMGGLVAKKYIIDNGSDKIDQLIFLGTPQLGAPKAFKVLMFGDNMSYKILFDGIDILSPYRVKIISQNMPSVYELLPSEKYVNENGNYVIDALNPSAPIYLNYDQTKNIMIDKGRNSLMFPFAEDLHDSIDYLDLSGVKSYNFVGCGLDTIGKIELKKKLSWKKLFLEEVDDYKLKHTDGDTTVPLVSADKTIGSEMFYVNKVSHGSLPASQSVINAITALLKDTLITFDDTLQDSDIYCGIEGDVVSTHSPVELHIYDEEGNHVGPDENGDIEYGIPNVSYDVLDEAKYAFLPRGINYKIITNATDTGGYNLNIESQDGEDIINSYNWTLVPLKTLDSTGEIWIGPDYPSEDYSIKMDDDGDGDVDNTYQENYDGTEEAEKIVYGDDRNHHNEHISSGSLPGTFNKFDIPRIEKNFDVIKDKNVALNYKTDEKIFPERQQEYKPIQDFKDNTDQQKNQNIHPASAINSNININPIWSGAILFVVMLILLAKMFIKL